MTYYDYEYTRPIEARGGIRAASRRGEFGSNWWAKRWTQTLEQFRIGARHSRGRSYARRGQVLSIDIQNGVVEAQVQGSRKRPYAVEISVRTIGPDDWERLRRALAEQPVIAASLLSGRMPENIEDTFRAVGLSMFPERSADLETDCSCPDWSNPCKHIAAVYLLLGEEFDSDPFLITRGRILLARDRETEPRFLQTIETAEEWGLITEREADNVLGADIIIRARRAGDRQYVHGVFEVSRAIRISDILRANDRASAVAKATGADAVAAVIGGAVAPRQRAQAEERDVRALTPPMFQRQEPEENSPDRVC